MRISVVVPVLNEADHLEGSLAPLAALRGRGHEVIVADGGSSDGSPRIAARHADRVLAAPRGRARQMNAGAGAATGDVLLFLHADTRLPDAAERCIEEAVAGARAWGRFDVRLSGRGALLRVIERLMSLRSCLSGIATGDQGLFVLRSAFWKVGGYPAIPLMEDIALSRHLRRGVGWPACVRTPVVTSSRRWERSGVVRTVLAMWGLRAAYALGADPWWLAAVYYGKDYAASLRTGEGGGEG